MKMSYKVCSVVNWLDVGLLTVLETSFNQTPFTFLHVLVEPDTEC